MKSFRFKDKTHDLDEKNLGIVVQMAETISYLTYESGFTTTDGITEISKLNKKFMNYFYSDSNKIMIDYNLIRNELTYTNGYKKTLRLNNVLAFSNRVVNCIKNVHEVTFSLKAFI